MAAVAQDLFPQLNHFIITWCNSEGLDSALVALGAHFDLCPLVEDPWGIRPAALMCQ